MARARGCSDLPSMALATASKSCSSTPAAGNTSVTWGVPWVTVPVLSSTTTLVLQAVSSASADLTRIPWLAPRPVPTITAVGVARPSAQGQLITSTVMACESAFSMPPPSSIHTTNVISAMPITTGTNTPAIWSAFRSIGALVLVASSTSLIIWARAVSLPTRVASTSIQPD